MSEVLSAAWTVIVGFYWICAVAGLLCFPMAMAGMSDDIDTARRNGGAEAAGDAEARAGLTMLAYLVWLGASAVYAVWWFRTH